MNTIRYARKCTATGKGMNKGFCYGDGDAYFINESDLIKHIREGGGCEGLSDEFVLNEAYALEEYYYTQWEEVDEDEWFDINGEAYSDLNTHLGTEFDLVGGDGVETEVWRHKSTGEEFTINIEIVRSL